MYLDGLLDTTEALRVGFRPISTEARRALKAEVLPTKPKEMSVKDFVREMTVQLQSALTDKEAWYTRLIRYKAIDQVDQSYFDDLVLLLGQWADDQEDKAEPEPEAAPEPPKKKGGGAIVGGPPRTVESLRDSLVQSLLPASNVTPWALTASLNETFREHGVKAKAQVVPAAIEKLSTSIPGTRKVKNLVAVVVGEGFTPSQVDLRHFSGLGWYDPLGLGSPQESAKQILTHVVEQMF